ncbi:hypothetical protein [Methyloceanibacter caenitepidi]|uniref:Uncharacterized protein n=1 Tax=Methyloceanibacter caenitepidi TaxID=1384459 RepID=A0A0A8K263_9HYPH|nr:hypothetical protein [Methyloceanibacter caenitepidi]BAQ16089.1 hypothetical protein GL4_0626 [Methyloceanibacter caenitepidi]
MKHTAYVGSISTGTLLTEDLLEAFVGELSFLADSVDHPGNRQTYEDLCQEAIDADPESEDAQEILNSLIDALTELAPPYCYFGAREGDGADFGFWPDTDSIAELPRVSDPNEVRIADHDWLFVNDHGNITIYSGATAQPILELV